MEAAVCFLVESSNATEPFLRAIRDNISAFLQTKAGKSHFRFNLAHFSRDHSFWDDETVECTYDSVSRAAEWMRGWQTAHYSLTPRGGNLNLSIGPKTLGALVTALSDRSTQAVYLVSASSPQESTNDLIQHTKFASKGRPVHVIFVSGHRTIDLAAMETLHLIAKETGGTFRIAYFNENGSLQQIMHRSGTRSTPSPNFDLFEHDTSSLNGSNLNSSHTSIHLNAPSLGQRSLNRADLTEVFNNYFVRSQASAAGPFQDLNIMPNYNSSPQPINSIKRYHNQPSKLFATPMPQGGLDDIVIGSRLTDLSLSKNDGGSSKLDDSQMSEIRKMFTQLYVGRKKEAEKEHKRKKYRSVKPKVYKYESSSPTKLSSKYRSSSSSSSSSASTNSDDYDSGDDVPNSALSHSKYAAKYSSRRPSSRGLLHSSLYLTTGRKQLQTERRALERSLSVSRQSSRAHSIKSGRSPRSLMPYTASLDRELTKYTGRKPAWKPIGQANREVLSHGPKTDRSKHWMDPWLNSVVHRESVMAANQNKRTKAIQATPLARAQSANSRVLYPSHKVSHGVQADSDNDHHHSHHVDAQQTIRELVKQNTNLIKVLEQNVTEDRNHHPHYSPKRSPLRNSYHAPKPKPNPLRNYSPREQKRIQQNRNRIIERIHAAQNHEQHEWEQLAKAAEAKRQINDEIKTLSSRRGPMAFEPTHAMIPETSRVKALQADRSSHIHNQVQRREDVKRHHQQENYKVMYERLLNEGPTTKNFARVLPQQAHKPGIAFTIQ
uniref:VWFA domain-containing protein n=1 Tax=Plectus sambesii TaxID=2011161 RepID=A0A914V0B9_9BILA